MDSAAYLTYLGADGDALAAAARRAPEASVPSCPEWQMPDLLAHTGGVHRWVQGIVADRAQEYRKRTSAPPENVDERLGWYCEGLTQLIGTLQETDASVQVWNWAARAPAPVAFWYRRMAHETAVHRWDGEAAAGDPQPIAADLAVDGIDEYLAFVTLWLSRQPIAGLSGSLHLHATDTDAETQGEWSLQLRPDGLTHTRSHTKADAAIRGPVSDLFLWLVNRIPVDSASLQVFGDRELIDSWGEVKF